MTCIAKSFYQSSRYESKDQTRTTSVARLALDLFRENPDDFLFGPIVLGSCKSARKKDVSLCNFN